MVVGSRQPGRAPPIENRGCRARESTACFSAEIVEGFVIQRRIECLKRRDDEALFGKAQFPLWPVAINANDDRDRLPSKSDHHILASGGAFHDLGELRLRFVNIDRHGPSLAIWSSLD
jgi:hypothetical protein